MHGICIHVTYLVDIFNWTKLNIFHWPRNIGSSLFKPDPGLQLQLPPAGPEPCTWHLGRVGRGVGGARQPGSAGAAAAELQHDQARPGAPLPPPVTLAGHPDTDNMIIILISFYYATSSPAIELSLGQATVPPAHSGVLQDVPARGGAAARGQEGRLHPRPSGVNLLPHLL